MPLLEVRDLCVHFPTLDGLARAVDGISFSLEEGQTLAISGESGCGKSSVALALLRLHPASTLVTGSVRFQDKSLFDLPERVLRSIRGRKIGMIFQDPGASLNPIRSVGSQIAEVAAAHRRLGRKESWKAALDLLHDVQLEPADAIARRYVHELSGGMQQRVAIAMALAENPQLIVADEPTAALDASLQIEILRLLRQLGARHRMALLLISHDLDMVAQAAGEVAVMYAGKIVERGPVAEVFGRPLHPYTAALLACRPVLGSRQRLRSIEGVVPPATRLPAGCRFRERCAHSGEECMSEPALEERGPDHLTACWHWERLTASLEQ
jgi:oligopeptide/dipeptide ABC transporter ATP-binding protein